MAPPELKAPLKAGRPGQTTSLAAGFPMVMHLHLVAYPMIIIVVVCLCRCNSGEGNGGGYGGEKDFRHGISDSLRRLGGQQPRLSRPLDEDPCSSRSSAASMTRWRGSYT
jgi:hypothetical protein